ncbi:hypothetical protein OSB04_002283 [Centaurea solstitialis]|uniref:Uncharacterized protein n=1 Tax=Centaurea solstitialis TaxID=347529 RepID=A0AA38WMM0_9ASTR|nr:hypothetical protein OSB04_002283 [Centaurea solstitialis]
MQEVEMMTRRAPNHFLHVVVVIQMMIKVALLCSRWSIEERPTMSKVVRMMEAEGVAERWEELHNVEVTRMQEYEMVPEGEKTRKGEEVTRMQDRWSPEERPTMSKVVRMPEEKGVAERLEELDNAEVTRMQEYDRMQRRFDLGEEDSICNQDAIELSSGGR